MLRFVRLMAALGMACSLGVTRWAAAAEIQSVRLEPAEARVGVRSQVRIDLGQAYDNPFDPEEIAVEATLQSPNGSKVVIPGFWNQIAARSLSQGREELRLQGQGHFALRFVPKLAGTHHLQVTAVDKAGAAIAKRYSFQVAEGTSEGFVRIDPEDPLSLVLDNGKPYMAVGANVDWSKESSGSYDLEAYYAVMQSAGMTWTRLWLTAFGEGFALEWGPWHSSGYYPGLGRYSLQVAAKLDQILETAEALGLRVQLVLWQHSQFETSRWSSWGDNPYNAARGGPATKSADFFTQPEAVRLSRQLLRYVVARYSAFASILAWEVMNEMEAVEAPKEVIAEWCEQRAIELRQLDPEHHLVTTSYLAPAGMGNVAVYESKVYDLSQAHSYWGPATQRMTADAQALRRFGKPLILAEYGLDPEGKAEQQDPNGFHLWEGSWVALSSGFNGGAMSWWWDTYLRPNDLFKSQTPLARVLQSVDLRGLHKPLPEGAVAVDTEGKGLETLGRRSAQQALLFVRHPKAQWKQALQQGMPTVAGGLVRIPDLPPATYAVRLFDSWSGELISNRSSPADKGGVLVASLPRFVGGIVIEIKQLP